VCIAVVAEEIPQRLEKASINPRGPDREFSLQECGSALPVTWADWIPKPRAGGGNPRPREIVSWTPIRHRDLSISGSDGRPGETSEHHPSERDLQRLTKRTAAALQPRKRLARRSVAPVAARTSDRYQRDRPGHRHRGPRLYRCRGRSRRRLTMPTRSMGPQFAADRTTGGNPSASAIVVTSCSPAISGAAAPPAGRTRDLGQLGHGRVDAGRVPSLSPGGRRCWVSSTRVLFARCVRRRLRTAQVESGVIARGHCPSTCAALPAKHTAS